MWHNKVTVLDEKCKSQPLTMLIIEQCFTRYYATIVTIIKI